MTAQIGELRDVAMASRYRSLLLATAVMVLGKGIHGLQEVGVLGLKPIPFFELSVLRIFPDAATLVPQIVLGLAAAWWWRRSIATARKPSLAV